MAQNKHGWERVPGCHFRPDKSGFQGFIHVAIEFIDLRTPGRQSRPNEAGLLWSMRLKICPGDPRRRPLSWSAGQMATAAMATMMEDEDGVVDDGDSRRRR